MPTASLVKLTPGINTELTPALNSTGWSSSNCIRWRNGVPEKLGGWELLNITDGAMGTIFAMHAWTEDSGTNYLAYGNATKLKVSANPKVTGIGASPYDVTPKSFTTNNAPQFNTTIGSASVTILDGGLDSPNTITAVNIATPISVGGLVLSGLYPVTANGAHTVTITAASKATANVVNGGAVASFTSVMGSGQFTVTLASHTEVVGAQYNIPSSVSVTVGGRTLQGTYTVYSVSVGSFVIVNIAATSAATVSQNSGNANLTYYTDIFGAGSNATIITGMTDWTFDNFGRYLVACAPGGPIYTWDPHLGPFGTIAAVMSQGPSICDGIIVADAQEMVIAWGCSDALGQRIAASPLQIRWCDAGDFTTWVASATNQAGSFTLPRGSKIVAAKAVPIGILIWTDIDLWLMQYIGLPNVWGFNRIAGGCGLKSRHAATLLSNAVYWMSGSTNLSAAGSKFYIWSTSSGVSPLDCSVWDVVFQNMAVGTAVAAGSNSNFYEVMWFYQSITSSGNNDSYVKFNVAERLWDYGSLNRSAWIDQSVIGNALGADWTSSTIFEHEVGTDDGIAAMLPFAQTGYFMADESESAVIIDRITPDFKFKFYNSSGSTATLALTIYAAMFAGDTPQAYGPFTITSTTKWIDPSAGGLPYPRGALFAFKISSSDTLTWWRIGNIRYRYAIDGRAD